MVEAIEALTPAAGQVHDGCCTTSSRDASSTVLRGCVYAHVAHGCAAAVPRCRWLEGLQEALQAALQEARQYLPVPLPLQSQTLQLACPPRGLGSQRVDLLLLLPPLPTVCPRTLRSRCGSTARRRVWKGMASLYTWRGSSS